MVVEPYLDKINSVKFLTRKENNRNFNSFVSDLEKLRKQYLILQIEARYSNKFHYRYIIIDANIVYHSGYSFHELGRKGSSISIMEDEDQIKKIWDDFNNWWNEGEII